MINSRGLIAALLLAVLTASLGGCIQHESHVRFEGDKLFLPEDSSMLRFERARSQELPYVRFDGKYPMEWPEAARLPDNSYLRLKGSLNGRQATYSYLADFDGVCRGNPDDVMDEWKERIKDSGWRFSSDSPDVAKSYPEGMADNYLKVFAENPASGDRQLVEIIVYKHSNMDGWVHFRGSVILDHY